MSGASRARSPWPVSPVPETAAMPAGELTAEDAWAIIRRHGAWTVARASFVRFRYADGFSHSRALALQLCLAVVPFLIAFVGLSGSLYAERPGMVLRRTLLSVVPGGSTGALQAAIQPAGRGDRTALWLGLGTAVVALVVAMGQVERGANRIYGIRRDRPSRQKYTRAVVLAGASGVPYLVGFLVLVAGADFADAVEDVYGFDDDVVGWLAVPIAVVLMLAAVTVMIRRGPRRRQPGWSLVAVGAAVSFVLWLAFTGLLAGYLQASGSFGAVYGPLAGIMALLIWAQLTSMAILLGFAVTAQLEAARAGLLHPVEPDPGPGDARSLDVL
ncbi:MAG TPA: YihY/virulence factor BrkB family protein [Mycobacteriales bacterium]